MPTIQYSRIKTDEYDYITVILPGQSPLSASAASHSTYPEILAAVGADDDALAVEVDDRDADFDAEYLIGLFDPTRAVAKKFSELSERVSVAYGRIYFDGDEVETPLTKQIARFLSEGVDDWQPLVLFFEKVQQNPNAHSREQLYNWLEQHDFTIDQDGDIVGYKGVYRDGDSFVSTASGQATVDGEVKTGRIPNNIGSVITMPRSSVQHDPSVGCHRGLHVGTYEFASGYGNALLEVKVNPRDVVSVPTDCGWAKVRCCRYEVVDTIDSKYEGPVRPVEADGSDEDDDKFIITIDLAFDCPSA